jgi:hypothetical protein
MFTQNGINAFVSALNSLEAVSQHFKDMTGTINNLTYKSAYTGSLLNQIFNVKNVKLENTTASNAAFIFGTGTANASKNDICLAVDPTQAVSENNASTRIDNNADFVIQGASSNCAANQDNASFTKSQVWQYNGADLSAGNEIVITEIALVNVFTSSPYPKIMIAREKLETPIIVNTNGQTFTIAMTIGG